MARPPCVCVRFWGALRQDAPRDDHFRQPSAQQAHKCRRRDAACHCGHCRRRRARVPHRVDGRRHAISPREDRGVGHPSQVQGGRFRLGDCDLRVRGRLPAVGRLSRVAHALRLDHLQRGKVHRDGNMEHLLHRHHRAADLVCDQHGRRGHAVPLHFDRHDRGDVRRARPYLWAQVLRHAPAKVQGRREQPQQLRVADAPTRGFEASPGQELLLAEDVCVGRLVAARERARPLWFQPRRAPVKQKEEGVGRLLHDFHGSHGIAEDAARERVDGGGGCHCPCGAVPRRRKQERCGAHRRAGAGGECAGVRMSVAWGRQWLAVRVAVAAAEVACERVRRVRCVA
eukprot:Opistho-1_new@93538